MKGEFDRLAQAGATVVQEPYNPGPDVGEGLTCTSSDPDDDSFRLVRPMA